MANTKRSLSEKLTSKRGGAGNSNLQVARAIYNFAIDGGAISTIVAKQNAVIPANAVIIGATINSTTAPLSAGSATVSVGTSAGSSATAIIGATAKATLSVGAVLNGTPTIAVPLKLTAAGNITFSIAVGTLTAGVIEATVYYYVSATA